MERLAEARGVLTQGLCPAHDDHKPSLVNQRAQRCSRPTVSLVIYLYSEVVMLAIRLPQSIEKRLENLARRTGRTKTYYVREAILEHLEEIEDLYLAEGALERIRSGKERTIPLKQVMKRHGLQR
jgi:RHH-type transcriptional regulator, rel operon repressor / antitoxin RelB